MARRNNRVHQYLLRGLVSCGHCRRGCTGRHLPPGYDYYLCRTKTQPRILTPGERCPARYIPAEPLEELVWRDLCEVLAAPEMIVACDGAGSRRALAAAGDAGATRQPAPRPGGLRPADRAADGSLPGRRGAAGRVRAAPAGDRGPARGARVARSSELTHDADRSGRDRSPRGPCRGVLPARAAGLGRRRTSHRKRELLELLVDRVIVTDGEVEIRYVIPTGPEGEREPFCRLRTDYQVRLPGRSVPSDPGPPDPDGKRTWQSCGWSDHAALRRAASAAFAARHAPRPVAVTLLDRRLEPQLDQPQHVPVDDAPRHRLHEAAMRNRIEILRQIRIHDFCVAARRAARALP